MNSIKPEMADIFRKYKSGYLAKYSDKMLPSHKAAINAISNCRTSEMGCHIDTCQTCGHLHLFFHSCRNRSCPKCHAGNTQKWLEKKRSTLLTVSYFHVVFTLPSVLRDIVRSNQTVLYNCLFKAATQALTKLLADPQFAGGTPGMIAVLHTWTRDLFYHPHIHILIPAGVISEDGLQWIEIKKKKFLVPIAVLSILFRAIFMRLARKALPHIKFPESVWNKPWIVFSKPFLNGGEKILQYLARYIYRIAITNNRILADTNGQITFKYKNSKSGKWDQKTLDAFKFMHHFLQHVLPRGFHKVRSYGFLTPKYKAAFSAIKAQLETATEVTEAQPEARDTKNNATQPHKTDTGNYFRRCPKCKTGIMVVVIHIFHTKSGSIVVRPPPCKK